MTIKILQGNSLDILGDLEKDSIDTCVTSPPYWGLRDYGTEQVATQLNRNAVLCELNPEYVEIAQKRLQESLGMFLKLDVSR